MFFATQNFTKKNNEPLKISTKDGNAVVISEADYRGLIETLNTNNKRKNY